MTIQFQNLFETMILSSGMTRKSLKCVKTVKGAEYAQYDVPTWRYYKFTAKYSCGLYFNVNDLHLLIIYIYWMYD